jgi:uncharacterized membrane protein YbhN (UPF0104 family)
MGRIFTKRIFRRAESSFIMNQTEPASQSNSNFAGRFRSVITSGPAMLTISILFTAAAIWLVLRNTEFGEVMDDIARMPAWPFVAAFCIMLVVTFLRALRLFVIAGGGGAGFWASIETILIGYFFITLLPLRLGELIRIGYLTRRAPMPVLSATTVVGTERAMDLIGLAFIASVVLSDYAGRSIPDLPVPPWFLSLAAAGALATGLALGFWVKNKIGQGEARPVWARRFDELAQGLSSLGSVKRAGAAFFISVTLWLLVALAMIVAFKSVDYHPAPTDVVIIMLGTCFSIALPSTPGSFGTYHVGFVYAALLVGIPRVYSLPVAIVFHLVIQLPFLPLGAAVLLTGGRSALAKAPQNENEKM